MSSNLGDLLRSIAGQPIDPFTNLRPVLEMGIESVRGIFGTRYEVDEIALLFPDAISLAIFTKTAYGQRFRLDDVSTDVVNCEPIVSRYAVEYWFFLPPLDNQFWPYPNVRIEAMLAGSGSPLHSVIRQEFPVSVHVSFKCPDEESYGLANGALADAGWFSAQRCTSNYGQFSYWSPPGGADASPFTSYLKPRLNTRDL